MAIPRSDAAHLLRRSGFGARPADIANLATAPTWEDAVDRVLDTSQAPPATMPLAVTQGMDPWEIRVELIKFWIERMRTSPSPIVEKMALFFHGHHFTGSWSKKDDGELAWNQIELFRAHALGDLHALTQQVAVDPWMLWYLDNGVNRYPSRVNENFGRELLELFTLGQGHFTEADVAAMTRAWTGHNLASGGRTYAFDPASHDDGPKTLFGITKNWDGPAAITEVLKGSKAVPASLFFVGKLWLHLVGMEPSAATRAALAAEFRASGLSLRTLVKAIFMHPDFRTAAARTSRVRSPIEWFVALTMALDVPASVSQPQWWIVPMAQDLFRPPNVAGWGINETWVNGSGWWRRGECARWLCYQMVNPALPYDRFPEITSDAAPSLVADTVFEAFGIVDPSPATRNVVESWAAHLSGTWHGSSMRYHSIPLVAMSPDFNLG